MSERRIVRLVISGRVQGVGFRYFVEREAARRSLEGWVRNRRDGAVEALIAGAPEAVEVMGEACRRGPPGARVDAVDIREADASELALRAPGERFSVLQTA
jgi:acylphosphatase